MSCYPCFIAEDNKLDMVSDLPRGVKGQSGSNLGARCWDVLAYLRHRHRASRRIAGARGTCPLAAAAGGHVKHTGAFPTAPGICTKLWDHAWGGCRGSQPWPLHFPVLSTTLTAAIAWWFPWGDFPTHPTSTARCSHTLLFQLHLNAWSTSEFLAANLMLNQGFCTLKYFSMCLTGCLQLAALTHTEIITCLRTTEGSSIWLELQRRGSGSPGLIICAQPCWSRTQTCATAEPMPCGCGQHFPAWLWRSRPLAGCRAGRSSTGRVGGRGWTLPRNKQLFISGPRHQIHFTPRFPVATWHGKRVNATLCTLPRLRPNFQRGQARGEHGTLTKAIFCDSKTDGHSAAIFKRSWAASSLMFLQKLQLN